MAGEDHPVPGGRIRRTMPLAGFTARAAGGRLVAGLRERAGDPDAVERFHERTADRYADLLGHSKGVLMKAGQLLSMVDASCIGSGAFSPYQKAMTRLQADAPPMDPALAKEVLQSDLGRSVDDLFTEFDDEPLAAASIGQVHRAVMRDGREVAVKIQYPGAAEAIRDDLANSELLVTIFRMAASASGTAIRPDFRQMAREIATRISEEIDYRHEAKNVKAFNELYRDHPFIQVPEIIEEASGDRVLTMTFLHGLDWAAAQNADQDLKNTWAEVIHRFATGSFRHANLFHADPHPGNYRFGLDGTVGFVDFGCIKILPEPQRHRFVEMVRAAVDGRKRDMRHLMVETGYLTVDSTVTADEAYQLMAQLVHELVVAQPVTYTPETSQRAIHAMLDVRSANHPGRRMTMPDDFVFLTRFNLSINAICAALNATIHARSIWDDLDGTSEPITPLGIVHHQWARQRGLPNGMDHHDHP